MADKALQPIEQKQVIFYEDEITAVKVESGEVFIPIRPICNNLGITLAGQRERINRDPVLSEAATSVSVTLTQQARDMICLPLKFLPGWLFGVNANRVKPEIRERLIRYQRECFEVLWEAFQEGRLTTDTVLDVEALAADGDEAAQALIMAQAIVRIARQQLAYQQKTDTRIDALETAVTELTDPGRHITEVQATQISQAVKAVAMAHSKVTRKNEYGAVYGEMYRRYQINSYKLLPVKHFEDATSWLNDWLQMIVGDAF